jgi:hypothetical protein
MVAGTLFLCGSCLGYAFWFIIQVPYWYRPWNLAIILDFHTAQCKVTMSEVISLLLTHSKGPEQSISLCHAQTPKLYTD